MELKISFPAFRILLRMFTCAKHVKAGKLSWGHTLFGCTINHSPPDLTQLNLSAQGLHPAAESININERVLIRYFYEFLPMLVNEGSDGQPVSSSQCDVKILQVRDITLSVSSSFAICPSP